MRGLTVYDANINAIKTLEHSDTQDSSTDKFIFFYDCMY